MFKLAPLAAIADGGVLGFDSKNINNGIIKTAENIASENNNNINLESPASSDS